MDIKIEDDALRAEFNRRLSMIENESLTEEEMLDIAAESEWPFTELKPALAKREDLTDEAFEMLMCHPTYEIKLALIKPSLTQSQIRSLMYDKNSIIRTRLIEECELSEETLHEIIDDFNDTATMLALCDIKSLPSFVLSTLVMHSDATVRRKVATRTDLDEYQYLHILSDSDPFVRDALAHR